MGAVRPFDVPLLPVERSWYAGELVCIGDFACAPSHPSFTSFGPATSWCVAFPRNAVWIRHRDDRSFAADAAIATLYNRGDEYERAPIHPAGDRSDWIAVAPSVLADIVSRANAEGRRDVERPFDRHHVACAPRTLLAERRLMWRLSHGAADSLGVEEAALALVESLVQDGPVGRDSGRAGWRLAQEARALLGREYAKPLTLGDIAAALECSPYHVSHTFRDVTGMTLGECRERLRLAASLDRLASGGGRIVDVALDLGYSSHSHFGAAFKRAFGITPAQFSRATFE